MDLIQTSQLNNSLENLPYDVILGEKNLETLGFFNASTKRNSRKAKSVDDLTRIIEVERKIDGKRIKAKITFVGTGKYGLPIVVDLDIYRAFQKICTEIYNQEGKLENPITFTTADIRKALERKKSGRLYEEVKLWMGIMTATMIEGEATIYHAKKGKWINSEEIAGGIHIFDKYILKGQILPDGNKAGKHYTWASGWYLESFIKEYYKYVDHNLHKSLKKPTAKVLYPLLDKLFYASDYKDKRASKRYSDLCRILGIMKYNYLSDIKRFLEPSFKELQINNYLRKWDYKKAKDKKDFIVYLWPGKRYFDFHSKGQSIINVTPEKSKKPQPIQSNNTQLLLKQELQKKPPFDEKKQKFVDFLKDQGVNQAEIIIKKSPHSADLMEAIKNDFNKKLAEGFEFYRSSQAWLRSAFSNPNYQKPNNIKTEIDIQRENKIREETAFAWKRDREKWDLEMEYDEQYLKPIIEKLKKESPMSWDILYKQQTEEYLNEASETLKGWHEEDPNRFMFQQAITGKCYEVLKSTQNILTFEEWKKEKDKNN